MVGIVTHISSRRERMMLRRQRIVRRIISITAAVAVYAVALYAILTGWL